jgi:hypothetical protein
MAVGVKEVFFVFLPDEQKVVDRRVPCDLSCFSICPRREARRGREVIPGGSSCPTGKATISISFVFFFRHSGEYGFGSGVFVPIPYSSPLVVSDYRRGFDLK